MRGQALAFAAAPNPRRTLELRVPWEEAFMRYGTIVRWDLQKKFGFIRPDRGPDIFFHISALGGCREPRIEIGQPVKYEIDPKTLPKRVKKEDRDDEKPPPAPISAKAMMVELIDKI